MFFNIYTISTFHSFCLFFVYIFVYTLQYYTPEHCLSWKSSCCVFTFTCMWRLVQTAHRIFSIGSHGQPNLQHATETGMAWKAASSTWNISTCGKLTELCYYRWHLHNICLFVQGTDMMTIGRTSSTTATTKLWKLHLKLLILFTT